MGYRVAMVVGIVTFIRVDEVRMRIYPNDLQIFVVCMKSVECGCAD
jgi:hypothetical protein